MFLRFSSLIVLAASLIFLQLAAKPILEQNQKVANWPAVEVTALARFVDPLPSRVARPLATSQPGGVGALPPPKQLVFVYRHEVNGVVYRNPVREPRTAQLAPFGPRLLAEEEASYTLPGHYNPERPNELFLPKAFGFADYWQVFFWGPLLGLGFGGLVLRKPGYSSRMRGAGAAAKEKGWYPLRPKYSIRHRASGAAGVAIVTSVILAFAAYDYLTGQPRARTPASSVWVGFGLLPGVATVALAVYYLWMSRRVSDAVVTVNALRPTPGTRLAVKFELPVKSDVDLEHVTVSLTCVRTAFTSGLRLRERVIWEDRVERDLGGRTRRGPAGGRATFEQRFVVPEDAEPTSSGGVSGPWVDWEIRVQFHLDRGPDYRGKFPLVVEVERKMGDARAP